MSTITTRREVAKAARVHGQTVGATEGFGTRGRVSQATVLTFLQASAPATVREVGAAVGIEVPAKGKIKADTLVTLANAVALNAPKAEQGE